MNRVSILGMQVDNLDLHEAVARIEELIKYGEPSLVVTANPEIIWLARGNKKFAECLLEAKMITADGIGVIIAAKILGQPLKQRVTGIALLTELFKRAQDKKYKFYFVGGKPGIAERAAGNIKNSYPGVEIVGIHHGYFEDDSSIIEDIRQKRPDILLVALGMGKQEQWIRDRVFQTGVPVSVGVGGSFDVFSGETKRAPLWMQRKGIEWLYRLIMHPSRFRRMLQLPRFLMKVCFDRVWGKSN